MYLETHRKEYANRGIMIPVGIGDMAYNVPGFPFKDHDSPAPNMGQNCGGRGTGVNDRDSKTDNRGVNGRIY